MKYRVILSRSARKQLERFSGEISNRIFNKLSELEINPRPPGCKKLQNRDAWRIRIGDRTLGIATLKTIIKKNGFDPAKASVRWTEPDKFVALIVEQSVARLKRGSAFLPAKTENKNEAHLQ